MPELVRRFNNPLARQRLDDEHVHAAPLEEALRAQPLVQIAVEPHLHGSASATARDDARYLCHSSLRSMPSATCAILQLITYTTIAPWHAHVNGFGCFARMGPERGEEKSPRRTLCYNDSARYATY